MLLKLTRIEIREVRYEYFKPVSNFSMQDESLFLACRRYSTSLLTPDSSDGSFPSDLLSKKRVSTPEREIGII